MKKSPKKLKLATETVRILQASAFSDVNGGYPTETRLASGCTVTVSLFRPC